MKVKILLAVALLASQSAYAAKTYDVMIMQVSNNLYQVTGKQNVYIKTSMCIEIGLSGTLKMTRVSGYGAGKLYFDNGNACDVEAVLAPMDLTK